MQPRIIMVPYNGFESETAAMLAAFNMAREYRAHVNVWHINSDPAIDLIGYANVDCPVIAVQRQMIDDLTAANGVTASKVRAKYLSLATQFGMHDIDTPPVMDAMTSTFHSVTGVVDEITGLQGRLSDLIILSRTPKKDSRLIEDIIRGALLQSARPLLLIPPGAEPKPPSNNVLVAWNGSMEAARAVAFALPYLKGKTVRIVTQQMESGAEPALLPSDLAHYLKRHGIAAQAGVCWNKDMTLPHCLIEAAREDRSDMIIMGAYSHNRMREAILGGVTDYMLREAEFPVFMVR